MVVSSVLLLPLKNKKRKFINDGRAPDTTVALLKRFNSEVESTKKKMRNNPATLENFFPVLKKRRKVMMTF